jgi:hypothetical protein
MGLYYDGTTGYYYKFNEEKNIYEYHFQVELEKPRPENKVSRLEPIVDPQTNFSLYSRSQVHQQYSVDCLLNSFSHLNITQMRSNALGNVNSWPP